MTFPVQIAAGANALVFNTVTLAQTRVSYSWTRLEQLDQWWHWIALTIVALLVATFITRIYTRDGGDLPPLVKWSLVALRLAAVLGLLVHFLGLEKRTEQRVVRNSRVAVLVDASLSMNLPASMERSSVASQSRITEATTWLTESGILDDLSGIHDVSIYRFDSSPNPTLLANVPLTDSGEATAAGAVASNNAADATGQPALLNRLKVGRVLARLSGGTILVASLLILACLIGQFAGFRSSSALHASLMLGVACVFVGLLVAGFAAVPNSKFTLGSLWQGEELLEDAITPEEAQETAAELPSDWKSALNPSGSATRLGDALAQVLDKESGQPLAGLIVLSDGRSNAGVDPRRSSASAAARGVPIHFIGLGSEKTPPNISVAEVDTAKRLYPGDRFSLTGILASSGYAGQTVSVQVLAGREGTAPSQMAVEQEQSVVLKPDGELSDAEFQLPPKGVGSWDYAVQVVPPPGDYTAEDNVRVVTIEVIERKSRVLIFAGGPSREYQFVRNLMYRDRDVESHVLLQSGSTGSSQEAQQLLTKFPSGRSELSQYDAILAFDPDWTQVPDADVEAVEKWVAEQAGGLLMVAGSVEMPKWVSRSAAGRRGDILRSLSPVVLERRGSRFFAAGRIESPTAWPLALTPDAATTEFMWVADDPAESLRIWQDFEGIYGFYAARELKPGAKAQAYFSDPQSAVAGNLPVIIASQFYGAGRVGYLGSSEVWRLRMEGDAYFDRFYIKLLRWLSQGRLLLDSDRGVVLVDREQASVGEQISVRAVLRDEQYEPLLQGEVVARLSDPLGRNIPLILRPLPDGSQPGVYTGQFPLLAEGEYLVELQLGSLASDEVLSASVQAKVPANEMQFAQRNDNLIEQITTETNGRFWKGCDSTLLPNDSLVAALPSAAIVTYVPGTPDTVFQVRLLGWFMAWIATCLALEWLTRRVFRLA